MVSLYAARALGELYDALMLDVELWALDNENEVEQWAISRRAYVWDSVGVLSR